MNLEPRPQDTCANCDLAIYQVEYGTNEGKWFHSHSYTGACHGSLVSKATPVISHN